MSVDVSTTAPAVAAQEFKAEMFLGELLPALKASGVGMATRPVIPVLSLVHLSAEAHIVTLSCFDYASSGCAEVVSDVESYGQILLPYKQLVDLLTAAGKGTTKRIRDRWTVSIRQGEGDTAVVTVNGTEYRLLAGPLNEYPTLPDVDAGDATDEIVVDTAELIRLMDAAAVASSKDDTLPILAALKLEVSNSQLDVLSTDRYRLFKGSMPVFGINEMSGLIPVKVWKKIRKHLNVKIATVVRFHDTPTNKYAPTMVSFHNETVSATLGVDGDYPKLQNLFPTTVGNKFSMLADDVAAAVTALMPVIERNTPVRLTFGTDDWLVLDGGTGEDAQATAKIPFEARDKMDAPFVTAFNPHYLLEGVQLYKGEAVTLGVTIPPKPAVFDPKSDEDKRYLIMPVRLPGQ